MTRPTAEHFLCWFANRFHVACVLVDHDDGRFVHYDASARAYTRVFTVTQIDSQVFRKQVEQGPQVLWGDPGYSVEAHRDQWA